MVWISFMLRSTELPLSAFQNVFRSSCYKHSKSEHFSTNTYVRPKNVITHIYKIRVHSVYLGKQGTWIQCTELTPCTTVTGMMSYIASRYQMWICASGRKSLRTLRRQQTHLLTIKRKDENTKHESIRTIQQELSISRHFVADVMFGVIPLRSHHTSTVGNISHYNIVHLPQGSQLHWKTGENGRSFSSQGILKFYQSQEKVGEFYISQKSLEDFQKKNYGKYKKQFLYILCVKINSILRKKMSVIGKFWGKLLYFSYFHIVFSLI